MTKFKSISLLIVFVISMVLVIGSGGGTDDEDDSNTGGENDIINTETVTDTATDTGTDTETVTDTATDTGTDTDTGTNTETVTDTDTDTDTAPPDDSEDTPTFEFTNVSFDTSKSDRIIVIGEVTNNSGIGYSALYFDLSLYDDDEVLLLVEENISVSNIGQNETRSFSETILIDEEYELSKYKFDYAWDSE